MLYHVPDLDRAVGELARVLRPGGRLVTMDDATVRSYAASWADLEPILELPPLPEPLRVRRHSTVFIAETA